MVADLNEPVISAEGLTKTFKVTTKAYSGLKEYMIQKVKGEINYKKLNAVDHVSFEVYRGDVFGIVGLNGAGKSTLLQVVAGNLNPTSGTLNSRANRIRILRFGEGFDMELTGRENIYLNGAICGYSKKYINEHYDEIVEFAELDGFMDEKVRKYSSGMRARLGFSIATAGEESSADVLILDEALAVGDIAFHKKSMARMKRMLHGGATVIMVSHSPGAIKEHCNRVMWMDNGKKIMEDTPGKVVQAYEMYARELTKRL